MGLKFHLINFRSKSVTKIWTPSLISVVNIYDSVLTILLHGPLHIPPPTMILKHPERQQRCLFLLYLPRQVSAGLMINNWDCGKEGEERPPGPGSAVSRAHPVGGTWHHPPFGLLRLWFSCLFFPWLHCIDVSFQAFAHFVSCFRFLVPVVAPVCLFSCFSFCFMNIMNLNQQNTLPYSSTEHIAKAKLIRFNLQNSTRSQAIWLCLLSPSMHILTKKMALSCNTILYLLPTPPPHLSKYGHFLES